MSLKSTWLLSLGPSHRRIVRALAYLTLHSTSFLCLGMQFPIVKLQQALVIEQLNELLPLPGVSWPKRLGCNGIAPTLEAVNVNKC